MKLAARKTSPQRLDRVGLTEDVAKRHDEVVGRSRPGGKIALIALVFAGCASDPPPPRTPPPAATVPSLTVAPSYTFAAPIGPVEESKKALAAAAAEKDPHERCRLLGEAAILDPNSFAARRARAESRCAAAIDLLADAKAVFAIRRELDTAQILRAVATRAGDTAAMKDAADALNELKDPYDAAALYVAIGDHAKAAAALEELAANRNAKGASVDALDAKLSAIIEHARSKKPVLTALDGLLDAVLDAKKNYGTAWTAPKFLEALAAARSAGEDTNALATKAQKKGLFAGAEDAFEIERAIAAVRSGKPTPDALLAKVRAKLNDPAARALLAVTSKECGARLGHARAHAALGDAALRLDDDVEWVRSKCAGQPARAAWIIREPADVADAREITDPPAKRLRVLSLVKLRPDDIAAAAYAALVADYFPPSSVINDPVVQESLFRRSLAQSTGKPSLARTRAYVDALRASVESDVPRASAEKIALILEQARVMTVDTRPGWEEIAAFVVKDCAAGLPGKCFDTEVTALSHATELLRSPRPFVLASHGMKLSKEDFADGRVRLDVIFALLTWEKHVKEATQLRGPAYGLFPGPEGHLANALLAATAGNCGPAKISLKEAAALAEPYADAFAYIAKACK
jgi:hypothetical protein